MNVRDVLRGVRATLAGGWSPAGAAAIALMVAIGLMALGVLHVYLKSLGVILTRGLDRTVLVRMGPEHLVRARGIAVRTDEAGRLRSIFRGLGYDLSGAVAVPRVYLASLPDDLEAMEPVAERKKLFLLAVLPQVLMVNELIAQSRRRLLALRADAEADVLGRGDRYWLEGLFRRYRVENEDLAELVRRVDVVPVPMALAQAAIESGWGTSRFAREGNALFGQWTWASQHGLVPRLRDDGATHSVRRFSQIADSVSAYMRNLNTHPAYTGFRRVRAGLRAAGKSLDAIVLARALRSYSERGETYVKEVVRLIRRNRLLRLARARLMERTCRDRETVAVAERETTLPLPFC